MLTLSCWSCPTFYEILKYSLEQGLNLGLPSHSLWPNEYLIIQQDRREANLKIPYRWAVRALTTTVFLGKGQTWFRHIPVGCESQVEIDAYLPLLEGWGLAPYTRPWHFLLASSGSSPFSLLAFVNFILRHLTLPRHCIVAWGPNSECGFHKALGCLKVRWCSVLWTVPKMFNVWEEISIEN